MIENDQQYQITKDWRKKLEDAIIELQGENPYRVGFSEFDRACRETELAEMKKSVEVLTGQIKHYEAKHYMVGSE